MLEVLVEDVGPSLLFGTAQVARNPRDGQSAPQSGAWGNTPQQPAQGGWGAGTDRAGQLAEYAAIPAERPTNHGRTATILTLFLARVTC